jgi:dihydropyrimidinase
MFEGFAVKGNARMVLSRGEVIVEGDKFLGKPGRFSRTQNTPRS